MPRTSSSRRSTAFGVDPAGRVVLDAGASTGGFSQVLLERGARTVLAVDVGHGQLAPELRDAPGLVLVEGCNVRNLDRAIARGATGVDEPPSLVTADLSFISLTTVLPALRATAADDADFVLLVKPQFEVGRGGVREGVVRDAGAPVRGGHERALGGVRPRASAPPASCPPQSPAATATTNTSSTSARSRGVNPTEWMRRVERTDRRRERVNDARHFLVVPTPAGSPPSRRRARCAHSCSPPARCP